MRLLRPHPHAVPSTPFAHLGHLRAVVLQECNFLCAGHLRDRPSKRCHGGHLFGRGGGNVLGGCTLVFLVHCREEAPHRLRNTVPHGGLLFEHVGPRANSLEVRIQLFKDSPGCLAFEGSTCNGELVEKRIDRRGRLGADAGSRGLCPCSGNHRRDAMKTGEVQCRQPVIRPLACDGAVKSVGQCHSHGHVRRLRRKENMPSPFTVGKGLFSQRQRRLCPRNATGAMPDDTRESLRDQGSGTGAACRVGFRGIAAEGYDLVRNSAHGPALLSGQLPVRIFCREARQGFRERRSVPGKHSGKLPGKHSGCRRLHSSQGLGIAEHLPGRRAPLHRVPASPFSAGMADSDSRIGSPCVPRGRCRR